LVDSSDRRAIGGYLELELGYEGSTWHAGAFELNSAINAFRWLLERDKPARIFLPCFTCHSIVKAAIGCGTEVAFYGIDRQLEIARPVELRDGDRLVAVNYFGLKSRYMTHLWSTFGEALLIDNAQAFFYHPPDGCEAIYSPTKFFGLCDGGYLYTSRAGPEQLATEVSGESISHLVGRLERGPELFYEQYRQSEIALSAKPVMSMSRLTRRLLGAINYEQVKLSRERNFLYLHHVLGRFNRLDLDFSDFSGPLAYPFWCGDGSIREQLKANRIYTPIYWPEVVNLAACGDVERDLVANLLPLPVDQRYELVDMQRVAKQVLETLGVALR
jgi:hypothetical protein